MADNTGGDKREYWQKQEDARVADIDNTIAKLEATKKGSYMNNNWALQDQIDKLKQHRQVFRDYINGKTPDGFTPKDYYDQQVYPDILNAYKGGYFKGQAPTQQPTATVPQNVQTKLNPNRGSGSVGIKKPNGNFTPQNISQTDLDKIPPPVDTGAQSIALKFGQPIGSGVASALPFDYKSNQPTATAQSQFGNLNLSDLADVAKLGVGLYGATQTMPTYSKPQAWNDYVARSKQMSTMGYTPEEMSVLEHGNERNYSYDVGNIMNLSGGNAGTALGNLGRAATSLYDSKAMVGAQSAALQRQNFTRYGGVLGQDMAYNRQIYDDQARMAEMNKMQGAGLASDALYNLAGRQQYNQTYGPGSQYDKWMQARTANMDETNQYLKTTNAKFQGQLPGYNNTPGSMSADPRLNPSYTPDPNQVTQ